MHVHVLHPGEAFAFEYTVCVTARNNSGPLHEEQADLDRQRDEMLTRMTRRIREVFDSIALTERRPAHRQENP